MCDSCGTESAVCRVHQFKTDPMMCLCLLVAVLYVYATLDTVPTGVGVSSLIYTQSQKQLFNPEELFGYRVRGVGG